MKREKALLKNTIIIAFGTILPKLASIITLPIITAKLTKTEYGIYDIISIAVSLFLPVVTLQIQSAAFRFLIEYEKDERKKSKIISTIMVFVSIVSICAMIIMFFALFKFNITTRILIEIYFLADILLAQLQQISRGLHKNKLYSLSSVMISVINMILVFILIQCLGKGLNGVIISIGVATCITAIFLLIKLNFKKYIKLKDVKRID